ncbi:hypothetical protein IQ268_16790 [Oculatella sp. LEGE 06141]|uniref:hypothetical protein n=1 Tax=Oculatella sp. LEGE 06141 TaxID=1828648 RepID=UPI001881D7F1|nr:hypothetical protein [Oculatella sp. LEGE 06141]MBE9180222.1 hypothetical protein [Oculatella sp. LEGE 06141]
MIRFKRTVGRSLYFFVTGLGFALLLSGVLVFRPDQLMAATSSIPVVEQNGALIPDFNQISFNRLPALEGSGSFEAPPEMKIGSFSWTEGDRVADVVPIGTFPDDLMTLDLTTVSALGGVALESTALRDFFPMELQTLGTLVESIPSLEEFRIDQVPPVDTLLEELVGNVDNSQTIGELLEDSSHLNDLAFVDAPASLEHAITSIPNLDRTAFQDIFEASESPISGIPGLENAVWADLFSSISIPRAGEVSGLVDIVFSPAESKRDRPISGSTEQPNAICNEGCAHIELSSANGSSALRGRHWMSGKYQKVEGGFGVLQNALSYDGSPGMEPTGLHPFGNTFKVALWDTDETEASASFALFFRICKRGIPDLGCTPYAVGPIPILTLQETDPIYLGLTRLGGTSGPSTMTSESEAWLSSHRSGTLSPSATTSSTGSRRSTAALTATDVGFGAFSREPYRGVETQRLSGVLAQAEGANYSTVSPVVCDGQQGCSRVLGLGLKSNDPAVRDAIAAKSGGAQFLSDVDRGGAVPGVRLLEYLSQSEQDQLREAEVRSLIDVASQQVDPATRQAYENGPIDRMIARTAEIYFGGSGSQPGTEALSSRTTRVLEAYQTRSR